MIEINMPKMNHERSDMNCLRFRISDLTDHLQNKRKHIEIGHDGGQIELFFPCGCLLHELTLPNGRLTLARSASYAGLSRVSIHFRWMPRREAGTLAAPASIEVPA
jgi:hypothetical protein